MGFKGLFLPPFMKTKIALAALILVLVGLFIGVWLTERGIIGTPPGDQFLALKALLSPTFIEFTMGGLMGLVGGLASLFGFFYVRGENRVLKEATGRGLFDGYRKNFLDKAKYMADHHGLYVFIGRPTLALRDDPFGYRDQVYRELEKLGFSHRQVSNNPEKGPREFTEISKKAGGKTFRAAFDIPTTLYTSNYIGRAFSEGLGKPLKMEEETTLYADASKAFFTAFDDFREHEVAGGGFIKVEGKGNNHPRHLAEALAQAFDSYFKIRV